jgi:surface protein
VSENKRPMRSLNRRYVRENNEYTVRPKTRKELEKIIKETIEEQGNRADLNFIDTSLIDDMSYLFDSSDFNGDISKWDVSNVRYMNGMFYNCDFEGDISKWDVSNVRNMNNMFAYSNFNGDISNWDVSNVKLMNNMLYSSKFNGDISKWDVRKVKNMKFMFYESPLEEKYGTNGENLKSEVTESYRRRYRR